MFTWYSAIRPSAPTITSCSFTHALFTPRSVFVARAMPTYIASAKLSADRALISVTRATSLMGFSSSVPHRDVLPLGNPVPLGRYWIAVKPVKAVPNIRQNAIA